MRSWFDLLYNWPPNSELLLINSSISYIMTSCHNMAPDSVLSNIIGRYDVSNNLDVCDWHSAVVCLYLWVGPRREKICLWRLAHNKGAKLCASALSDQHLCYSLFGQYHVNLLKGIFSTFWLVPVAEETGLKLALSETPRQVFSRRGPYNNILT